MTIGDIRYRVRYFPPYEPGADPTIEMEQYIVVRETPCYEFVLPTYVVLASVPTFSKGIPRMETRRSKAIKKCRCKEILAHREISMGVC